MLKVNISLLLTFSFKGVVALYGPIIKKLRTQKGLSLQTVYKDVCSKTNSIKFEKGERNLSIDKFLTVLDTLMIDMEEFLWIQNMYKPINTDLIEYRLNDSFNENDVKSFNKYLDRLEENSNYKNKLKLASYRLLKQFLNQNNFNESDLEIIINYFKELKFWTINDLELFSRTCQMIPYNFMLTMLNEAIKVASRYLFFNKNNYVICNLLSNCISIMIDQKDITNAERFINTLSQFNDGIKFNGYKLLSEYYKSKIDFLYRDKNKGLDELKNILYISKFLNNEQITEEIEALFENM